VRTPERVFFVGGGRRALVLRNVSEMSACVEDGWKYRLGLCKVVNDSQSHLRLTQDRSILPSSCWKPAMPVETGYSDELFVAGLHGELVSLLLDITGLFRHGFIQSVLFLPTTHQFENLWKVF